MESDSLLRVFLDTNVLFSGIYQEAGASGKLLDLAAFGSFTPVVSVAVIVELVRNVQRKAPHLMSRVERFFEESHFEVVANPTRIQVQAWIDRGAAEDSRIVAAALVPEVDYLCTGDQRFRERISGIDLAPKMVSPRQLLELIQQ